MEYTNHALGANIIPYNYELFFEPNFSDFKYKGEEKIYLKISKPTKNITLNSSEIEISNASITSKKELQECKFDFDEKNERVTFYFEKAVSGEVFLEIKFTGIHNDKMVGFYRSKYFEEKKEKYFMTTQFEAADARRAFPCFDEPIFKATFNLSLLIDQSLTAISNMPIHSEQKMGNKKLVTFEKTLRMSSYLLYIGVGDLDITSERFGKLLLRVITIPGKKTLTKLPLFYAKKFIAFYEKYFGIKYPLPKLDLIAVPDFAAGAMENWGAITFRETSLLGDEKSAITSKQRIAEVIAHEFTHQWFGDLVTMAWWNDLWLNESFANFMSYKAMEAVFPEWEMETKYIISETNTAFAMDQLRSTHPISVNVKTPAEIDQIFDAISYSKGGSILNMIEDYAGKDIFRKGLNLYLKKHSYSNATKDDLWIAIDEIANKSGKKLEIPLVANAWIEKKGYPYVQVSKSKNGFILKQKKFTLISQKSDNELWPIPILYSLSHTGKNKHTLLMKNETVEIKTNHGNEIKLNMTQKGFYRTLYPKDILEIIGEMIKEQELSPLDSWGVENDLYYFTKKGLYSIRNYLEFVNNYCFAAKYPLNTSVLNHLNGLYILLYNTKSKIKDEVKDLLKEYSNEILKQVGWVRSKNESATITILRSSAIISSGISGDKSTINKAKKMFDNYISGKHDLDPNLRTAIYEISAIYGKKDTFDIFIKNYEKENNPVEKLRYLQSLSFFMDKKLINKALDFSISKHVRPQDSIMIPSISSSNPVAVENVFKWTKKNWKSLTEIYPPGTHIFSRYVNNMASITDKKLFSEFNSFFSNKKNTRSDITNSIANAKEIITINLKFIEKATRR